MNYIENIINLFKQKEYLYLLHIDEIINKHKYSIDFNNYELINTIIDSQCEEFFERVITRETLPLFNTESKKYIVQRILEDDLEDFFVILEKINFKFEIEYLEDRINNVIEFGNTFIFTKILNIMPLNSIDKVIDYVSYIEFYDNVDLFKILLDKTAEENQNIIFDLELALCNILNNQHHYEYLEAYKHKVKQLKVINF